jgi:hypothetical protein
LNPHSACAKKDFKSIASADFATRAEGTGYCLSPEGPSATVAIATTVMINHRFGVTSGGGGRLRLRSHCRLMFLLS